jgi:hypothetical protein
MEILAELASLTDTEATQCLNRVLSGLKAKDIDMTVNPDDLNGILNAVAVKAGRPLTPKIDQKLPNREKAVRVVLLGFLGDPKLSKLVKGALTSSREVLLDPITTALVMAGIVVVLKTQIKIAISNKRGKWQVDGRFVTNPSSEGLIKKFFNLF